MLTSRCWCFYGLFVFVQCASLLTLSFDPSCGISLSDSTPHRASKSSRERYTRAHLKLSQRSLSCLTSVSRPILLVVVFLQDPFTGSTPHPGPDCLPYLFSVFFTATVRCRKLTIFPRLNSPSLDTCAPTCRTVSVTRAHRSMSRLDFGMSCSDIVRAPGFIWVGAQERPLDSGGSAEWGRFEDDLLEDDYQLIHTFRAQFLVAHPYPYLSVRVAYLHSHIVMEWRTGGLGSFFRDVDFEDAGNRT